MKRLVFVLILAILNSCSLFELEKEEAESRFSLQFVDNSYYDTRAISDLPDTNNFILEVKSSTGSVIYKGLYGDSPEQIFVSPGSYSVKVVSREFSTPAFDSPQYGDEQCVVVASGENKKVELFCSQMNSGVKLAIDRDFLTSYPSAALILKSSNGKLLYSLAEKRIAYFQPGQVSLIMTENASDKTLLTRTLKPKDILLLNVKTGKQTTSGTAAQPSISISVDTSRNWIKEYYTIGESSSTNYGNGEDAQDALTIAKAKNAIGEEDVWVTGYIVGGDLTSASMSFESPFKSRTNIVLAPRSSTNTKSSCVSVNLPSGTIRDALNLVDNPELLGKSVAVKGDIVEAYYGIVGIKNISDFVLK